MGLYNTQEKLLGTDVFPMSFLSIFFVNIDKIAYRFFFPQQSWANSKKYQFEGG